MTDSEWIANIHNFSNAEIFEQLEQIGCDGYYRDIWSACIEELRRRVNLTSGDCISREDLRDHISELILVYSGTELDNAILNAIDNAPTVPKGECEKCDYYKFTENYIHVFVDAMNKYGIKSIDQLSEILKGGAE